MTRFSNVALICQTIANELMIDEKEVMDKAYGYPNIREVESDLEVSPFVILRTNAVKYAVRGDMVWSLSTTLRAASFILAIVNQMINETVREYEFDLADSKSDDEYLDIRESMMGLPAQIKLDGNGNIQV